MIYKAATISNDLGNLPQLPDWVTSARSETPEDVAFLSGAALSHLHLVLNREDVPQNLLRGRLALRALPARPRCRANISRVWRGWGARPICS